MAHSAEAAERRGIIRDDKSGRFSKTVINPALNKYFTDKAGKCATSITEDMQMYGYPDTVLVSLNRIGDSMHIKVVASAPEIIIDYLKKFKPKAKKSLEENL